MTRLKLTLMLLRQRQAASSSSSTTTIRGGRSGGTGCGGMVLMVIRRVIYWCQSTRRHEVSIHTTLALAQALVIVAVAIVISCIEEEGSSSDGNFVRFRLHLQQSGHSSVIQDQGRKEGKELENRHKACPRINVLLEVLV